MLEASTQVASILAQLLGAAKQLAAAEGLGFHRWVMVMTRQLGLCHIWKKVLLTA